MCSAGRRANRDEHGGNDEAHGPESSPGPARGLTRWRPRAGLVPVLAVEHARDLAVEHAPRLRRRRLPLRQGETGERCSSGEGECECDVTGLVHFTSFHWLEADVLECL